VRRVGAIDWGAPWFAPVAECGRATAAEPDLRAALTDAARARDVRNARGVPVRFVASDAAGERAYEEHIGLTGEVPTRDNLHDFFNALMWITFPRAKARLNALQAAAIARDGIGSSRGPLRDAATLLDENAALVVTLRSDLVDALARHEWRRLFAEQRSAWRSEIRVVVFGHALLDKLTTPYRGVTAHALPVPLPAAASLAAIDDAVADILDARLAPRQLLPLPVLGIPGWAANDDATYYDDATVFRPSRRATPLEAST
jgi:hypothetical protein